ncbi:MAG TPA: hypothetical protein PKI24_22020 [Nitrospira sp.]|nr:hypothetical protein [Accumulibacter sp.]HNK51599.1 hypothetical protein [Nitrospira sp.]HNP42267.1 hypothetical protein [Nitrospira sp.]
MVRQPRSVETTHALTTLRAKSPARMPGIGASREYARKDAPLFHARMGGVAHCSPSGIAVVTV